MSSVVTITCTETFEELQQPVSRFYNRDVTRLEQLMACLEPDHCLRLDAEQFSPELRANAGSMFIWPNDDGSCYLMNETVSDEMTTCTYLEFLKDAVLPSGHRIRPIPPLSGRSISELLYLETLGFQSITLAPEQFEAHSTRLASGQCAALVGIGWNPKRHDNQDGVLIHETLRPFGGRTSFTSDMLVVDGMGGHSGGRLAMQTILDAFARQAYLISDPEDRFNCLATALYAAYNHSAPELFNAGVAATALRVVGDTVEVTHVGDTRAVLLRSGAVKDLTRDQTVYNDVLEFHLENGKSLGEAEQLAGQYSKHILSSCIAIDNGQAVQIPKIDTVKEKLQDGDIVINASDGLWNQIDNDTLEELVTQLSESDSLTAENLRDHLFAIVAQECAPNNSGDNISILVYIHQAADEVEADPPQKSNWLSSLRLSGLWSAFRKKRK